MYRIMIPGLEFPETYVAKRSERLFAAAMGKPFIVSDEPWDKLAGCVIAPMLMKAKPGIDWFKLFGVERQEIAYVGGGVRALVEEAMEIIESLGLKEEFEEFVEEIKTFGEAEAKVDHVIAEIEEDMEGDGGEGPLGDDGVGIEVLNAYRNFDCKGTDWSTNPVSLKHDGRSVIDFEVIRRMNLLPQWLEGLYDCVVEGDETRWCEGYDKKRALCLGGQEPEDKERSLVIIDVSGSIPDGISSTMLMLADDIRGRAKADLIITGSISRFYDMNDELPSPRQLRKDIGKSNESWYFREILLNKVAGRRYNAVFCFGDNDSPNLERGFIDAQIGHLYGFHTSQSRCPGYMRWAMGMAPMDIDTSWVKYV